METFGTRTFKLDHDLAVALDSTLEQVRKMREQTKNRVRLAYNGYGQKLVATQEQMADILFDKFIDHDARVNYVLDVLSIQHGINVSDDVEAMIVDDCKAPASFLSLMDEMSSLTGVQFYKGARS